MRKESLDKLAKELKEQMKKRRVVAKGKIKDIKLLIKAKQLGNYEEVYHTDLYNKHSAEYCEYLELLTDIKF